MKRNIWIAMLTVVAATAVGLPGQAWADVECRYAWHSGQPAPQLLNPNQLVQVKGVTQHLPYNRPVQLQDQQWVVLSVRPGLNTSYDLGLEDCDFSRPPYSISNLPFRAVDFIAIDAARPIRQNMFAKVTNSGEVAGSFALEYSAGGSALLPGAAQSLTLQGTPAVVRDVFVRAGTSVTVVLRPLSGDLDLAVMASGATSDTWVRSRAQAVQHSLQPGLAEERVTLSVPAGGADTTFGVVVVNNVNLSTATLHRL